MTHNIIRSMASLDLAAYFNKHSIKHGLDHRSAERIEEESLAIKQLVKKNFQELGITLTSKSSKKYDVPTLRRIELGNGIYCSLTDNQIKSEQTIITLHGAPAHYSEWAGLEHEMGNKYRWINLLFPGLDGEDQRRGSYDGTFNGFSILFLRLIAKLQLKRITICAHSFGTTVGFRLSIMHPGLIEGFINMAGLAGIWPVGMGYMYKACISDLNFYNQEWKNKKLYNQDTTRKEIYAQYVENFKKNNYKQVFIPLLKEMEYFGFLKLTFQPPKQFDLLFQRFKACDRLKVLAYGTEDVLCPYNKMQKTIYQILYGQHSFLQSPKTQKLLTLIKQPLQARLSEKLGVKINGTDIQKHLCYIFEGTGHNVHKRRCTELSKIIELYMIVLQVIYQHKPLLDSSL